MYALKGSWAGQTFALAASNSPRKKKSRTRISKEERKALAESFIKRYQSLNEGNFPSLNLTHKEVGGSFYTVREIVREIIQENKVLGPVKYTAEVNKYDTIAYGYPLGSISIEPQDSMLQSKNVMNVVSILEENNDKKTIDDNAEYSNHQDLHSVHGSSDPSTHKIGKDTDENLEVSLNSDGHCCNENESHNGKSTDGIDTIRPSNEYERMLVEQPIKEKSEVDGKLTIPSKEVEVENFPLNPAINEADETGSTLITEKTVDGSAISNFDGDSAAVTQHAVVGNMVNDNKEGNFESQSLETPDFSTMGKDSPLLIDGHIGHVAPNSDLRMSTTEENKELNEFQGTAHGAESSKTSHKSARKEPLFNNQSKRATSPTLDRINLESWPRTSKQETNPFLAFIKAFKDAFVKFWSA